MKYPDFQEVSTRAGRLPSPNRTRESRARGASRPAGPSALRQSRSHAHVSFRSSHNRRFQEFECAFPICIQARLYAQGYREHRPNGVPNWRTENDGNAERPQNSRAYFPYGGSSHHSRLTFGKLSQNNLAKTFEFSGLFQLLQDKIDLVGHH